MQVPVWIEHDIATFGYWAVLVAVALESMGVPFPGETALLAGAIYAGVTGRLDIALVIVAGAVGAILGDNIGYSIGRIGGYPLLRRLTQVLRIEGKSLRYTQRFFARYGGSAVFFGRFFSVLRTYVALLAGVNRMPRRSFFFWNAAGGIVWALGYGLLGYLLGHNLPLLATVLRVIGTGGVIALALFIAAVLAWWFVRRRRLLAHLDEPPPSPPSAEPPQLAASTEKSKRRDTMPSP
jgi:membrane protein DedA with SNARE-associated domain